MRAEVGTTPSPLRDLRAIGAAHESQPPDAAGRVLRSGWYVLGKEVERFEQEFAAYCGASHCVGVGDGHDGLFLILKAWGIGSGDEVVVPSDAPAAAWLAVVRAGAAPVAVEPCVATRQPDPGRVEAALTGRTRALLAVHPHGQPAPMGELAAIARRHGLKLVDEAGQAHGASVGGQRVGSLADATAFDFAPGRHLAAIVGGGAVVTRDAALATGLRRLRGYGPTARSRRAADRREHRESRLDELEAALLRERLPRLDRANATRQRLAAAYAHGLQGLALGLPELAPASVPSWNVFPVLTPHRELLRARLKTRGIETLLPEDVPMHRHPLGLARCRCPVADQLHAQTLGLPLGLHLSVDDVEQVGVALRQALAAV